MIPRTSVGGSSSLQHKQCLVPLPMGKSWKHVNSPGCNATWWSQTSKHCAPHSAATPCGVHGGVSNHDVRLHSGVMCRRHTSQAVSKDCHMHVEPTNTHLTVKKASPRSGEILFSASSRTSVGSRNPARANSASACSMTDSHFHKQTLSGSDLMELMLRLPQW